MVLTCSCHSGSAYRNGRSGEGTEHPGVGACTGWSSLIWIPLPQQPRVCYGDDPTSILGYQAFVAGKEGPHMETKAVRSSPAADTQGGDAGRRNRGQMANRMPCW